MKLVKYYSCAFEAEEDAERLEKRGILTHVTAKYSQKLSRLYTGAFKAGLWVLLERQHYDATRFLHDPNHKITTGIGREEIEALRKKAKPLVFEALNTAIAYGVLLAIVMLFIFLRYGTKQI